MKTESPVESSKEAQGKVALLTDSSSIHTRQMSPQTTRRTTSTQLVIRRERLTHQLECSTWKRNRSQRRNMTWMRSHQMFWISRVTR